MTRAVVVQVLARETPPRRRDGRRASHVAIHEEGDMIGQFGEGFEDEFAARDHFERVIGRDIGRKQLGFAGFVLHAPHGIGDERDRFLHRRE